MTKEEIENKIRAAGLAAIGEDGQAVLNRVHAAQYEDDVSHSDAACWREIESLRTAARNEEAKILIPTEPELAEALELSKVVGLDTAADEIAGRGVTNGIEFCRRLVSEHAARAAAEQRARDAVAAWDAAIADEIAARAACQWDALADAKRRRAAARITAIESGVLKTEDGYVYNPSHGNSNPQQIAVDLWKKLEFENPYREEYASGSGDIPGGGLYLHDD